MAPTRAAGALTAAETQVAKGALAEIVDVDAHKLEIVLGADAPSTSAGSAPASVLPSSPSASEVDRTMDRCFGDMKGLFDLAGSNSSVGGPFAASPAAAAGAAAEEAPGGEAPAQATPQQDIPPGQPTPVPQQSQEQEQAGQRPTTNEQTAIVNFARAKSLRPEEVSIEQVASSAEGVGHWAFVDAPLQNARSAEAQAFKRSLAHEQFVEDGGTGWAKLYPQLLDSMKAQFRRDWAVRRDFQFTRECRIHRQKHSVEDIEEGEYMNKLQIYNALGGKDDPEAVRQGDSYIATAHRVGGKFVVENAWTQAENVLFIKKLLRVTTLEEWEQLSEGYTKINYWEEKLKESRAIRNFAHAYGRTPAQVPLEEIRRHPLALDGWANMALALPAAGSASEATAASSSAGGKAGASGRGAGGGARQPAGRGAESKGKGRGGRGKAAGRSASAEAAEQVQEPPAVEPSPAGEHSKPKRQNPVATAEKEAKQLASRDQVNGIEVARITKQIDESPPEEWVWSVSFMKTITEKNKELQNAEQTLRGFVEDFKASMVSADLLKDLRKKHGDAYLGNLHRYIAVAEEPVRIVQETAAKINNMKLSMRAGAAAPAKKRARK